MEVESLSKMVSLAFPLKPMKKRRGEIGEWLLLYLLKIRPGKELSFSEGQRFDLLSKERCRTFSMEFS